MSHDSQSSEPNLKPLANPGPDSTPRWALALPVVNMVVLLVSLGLISYLIYDQKKEADANKPARDTAKEAKKDEEKIKPQVAKIKGEIKDLTKTVEERPEPPNYAPQIKAIDDRMADLGKSVADLTDRLDALGKKVDGVSKGQGLDSSPKFEAVEKRVGEMAKALEDLGGRVATLTTPASLAASEMDQGMVLFKQAKWSEAKDVFARLRASSPDDARVWYYSALATGLATRDWKGESERLVSEGMAREKAGMPDKVKIDAAFADLTPATGKDWLAFYRGRAGEAPERR